MTTRPPIHNYGTRRTVNAVKDLGWDKSGNKLTPKPPDETGLLIEIPPGDYRVRGMWSFSKLKDWALVGKGDSNEEVTFIVDKGFHGKLFNIRSGSYALSNFTIDIREDWETATGLNLLGKDWVLDKVHFKGWRPNEHQGTTTALNAYVTDPDGEGYINDFYADERVNLTDYPKCAIMIFSGPESTGDLYILDSTLENSGEHGVYASRCKGPVKMERNTFRNNQNTQARISGYGSYAKKCDFVWDSHNNKGEFQAQTGLTFESGFQGFAGGTVEDCRFDCRVTTPNSGVLKVDGSHGEIDVKNCSIHVADKARTPGFNAEKPGSSHMLDGLPDKPWDMNVESLSVIHKGGILWKGSKGEFDAAVESIGRDTKFKDLCVDVSDADDKDLHAIRYQGGHVEWIGDSTVIGSGGASRLATKNSTKAGWSEVASEGSCPSPDSKFSQDEEQPEQPEEEPVTSYEHMGVVKAAPGTPSTRYRIVTTGPIALVTDGPNKSETSASDPWRESVEEQDDGTWVMKGGAADKGLDALEFEGEVISFTYESDEPDALTLTVDGKEWTPPEETEEDTGEETPEEPEELPDEIEEPPEETEEPPEDTTEPSTLKEQAESQGYIWVPIDNVIMLIPESR